jgi:hypothetical protein|tara:strand:+ start:348 stop:560 length:213 start_codon:yes stop_codon:yes gene_type:complete
MKKVTIKEGDLKKIIHKSLGKQLTESTIPENVMDYVKENPKIIIDRLMETHGENFFDLVGETYSNKKNIL